jgi:hypothetical protein
MLEERASMSPDAMTGLSIAAFRQRRCISIFGRPMAAETDFHPPERRGRGGRLVPSAPVKKPFDWKRGNRACGAPHRQSLRSADNRAATWIKADVYF